MVEEWLRNKEGSARTWGWEGGMEWTPTEYLLCARYLTRCFILIIVLEPSKGHVMRYRVSILLMRNGGLGVKWLPMDIQLATSRPGRGTQTISLHIVL